MSILYCAPRLIYAYSSDLGLARAIPSALSTDTFPSSSEPARRTLMNRLLIGDSSMGSPARCSSRRGEEALEGARFSPGFGATFVELEHLLLEVVDDTASPRIAFRPVKTRKKVKHII